MAQVSRDPSPVCTAVAGEADSVSSVSASACHSDGPIGVNPGKLALVYGILNDFFERKIRIFGLEVFFFEAWMIVSVTRPVNT